MSKNPTLRVNRSPARLTPLEGDGHKIGNRILQNIGRKECSIVVPMLELVRLHLHQILLEPGEPIRSVHFLNDGLASVLSVQPDGKSVEIGLIGLEGFIGVPVVFGLKTSGTRVMTQGNATAYRISADALRSIFPQCRNFELALQRFSLQLNFQTSQIAVCNCLHDVKERLARWLLMSHDRIGDSTMPLTQEFLGQMLGTRRSSVSLAASALQRAGMITYTRGNVTILDRGKLEEVACDCYDIIERQARTWRSEANNVR